VSIAIREKDAIEELLEKTAWMVVSAVRDDLIRPTPELMRKDELAEYLRCDIFQDQPVYE
jgi:hypothetical protein